MYIPLILLCSAGIAFWLQFKLKPYMPKKIPIISAMLDCPFCTGFHTGYIAYLLAYWNQLSLWTTLFDCLVFGFASAYLVLFLDTLLDRLGLFDDK